MKDGNILSSPYSRISSNIAQLIDEAEENLDLNLMKMMLTTSENGNNPEQDSNDSNEKYLADDDMETLVVKDRSANFDYQQYHNYHNNNRRRGDNTNGNQHAASRSLFIGNLDPTISQVDLRDIFEPYGHIESLRMLPSKECAFVNFTTAQEAMQAKLVLKGRPIGNLVPRIGFGRATSTYDLGKDCEDFGSNSNTSHMASTATNITNSNISNGNNSNLGTSVSRSVWVGQISSTTTKEQLHHQFSKFGAIQGVRITMNKSCAFIDFCNLDSAIKAKNAMNGVKLGGSIIKTGYARGSLAASLSSSSLTSDSVVTNGVTKTVAMNGSLDNLSSPPYDPIDWVQPNHHHQHQPNSHHNHSLTSKSQRGDQESTLNHQSLHDSNGSLDEEEKVSYNPSHIKPDAVYNLPLPNPSECEAQSEDIGLPYFKDLAERDNDTPLLPGDVVRDMVIPKAWILARDANGNIYLQRIIERLDMTSFRRLFDHLYPYFLDLAIVALMQDQFGNYVVQCLLNLGMPAAFVLEAFHRHLLDIATTRYGARALKNALTGNIISQNSKRYLFKAMAQQSCALVRDLHGIILLHWLLDVYAQDLTATLVSHLRGQFAALSFAKPTAAIVSRLLEMQSIARPLIIGELFSTLDLHQVWFSAVASAVLIKALQLTTSINEGKHNNGGELEKDNEALLAEAKEIGQDILKMAGTRSNASKGYHLRLHQESLLRQVDRLLGITSSSFQDNSS